MDRVRLYEEHLAKKPGDRFALYSLALEHKKAGDVAAADAAFQRLLAAHPQAGAGWYQYGLLFREQGDATRALAVWKRGLDSLKGATDAEARRSVGEIGRAVDELEDP
jgi:tetratricopeptide (TPR) repeat protein